MGPCEKWYELVVVNLVPLRDEPEGKAKKLIRYEVSHFLLPLESKNKGGNLDPEDVNLDELDDEIATAAKKDVDFTAKCLRLFLKKILRPTTKQLLVFTDGGAADFKNSKFENFLLQFQTDVNEDRNLHDELHIEHHIFAPNHGTGICDAAHAVGVKKLKIWALDNDKIIEKPEQVTNVFNSIKNHTAFVVRNDESVEDVRTLSGIKECYTFRFDSRAGKVLGYADCHSKVCKESWFPKSKIARNMKVCH